METTLNQTKISMEDFNKFFIDYHMGQQYHNQRFGQAFVNKYLLRDSKLFYEADDKKAKKIIVENYIAE